MTMPEPLSGTASNEPNTLEGFVINPDIIHARYDSASGGLCPPRPSRQHILNCAFGTWYPQFKRVAPKAKVISPLPDDFIKYLHADGIRLPNDNSKSYIKDEDDEDWEETCENDDESSDLLTGFRGLDDEINSIITEFGGAVFPKLNWSCPKDAAWMKGNSLKCQNSSDVYLLLKSSDFVTHDLSHAFDECMDTVQITDDGAMPGSSTDSEFNFELVLKKWFDFEPSMEFRCFIRNGRLVALTQREPTYYDFLASMRSTIINIIRTFWETNIQDKFPDKDYVMDVYITRDMSRCWLVDFNPWSSLTDTILYVWNDILQISCDAEMILRLVRADGEMSDGTDTDAPGTSASSHIGLASLQPNFTHNRLPREVVELSQGVTVTEFAETWEREMRLAAANVLGVDSDNDECDNNGENVTDSQDVKGKGEKPIR